MLWSERARRMLNAIEELRINLNGRYHIEKLRASANGRYPSGDVWQQLKKTSSQWSVFSLRKSAPLFARKAMTSGELRAIRRIVLGLEARAQRQVHESFFLL